MNIPSSLSTSKETRPAWLSVAPILALLVVFLIIATRRAWVGDDAYITFRTIDNLARGYSLTWNPGERVQAYTHPLWMGLLSGSYLVTREIFYTSIVVSLVVSLAAVGVLALKIAVTRTAAGLAVLALALSNAFVDYSTSGLENPLTHLLLAVFLALFLRGQANPRRLFLLSLVASLAGVNRLDTLLIYAPALLVALFELRAWKRGLLAGALGQLPLLGWELFSLVYYGFPFPNTAYAKLNNGIPAFDLIEQGLRYLQFSWEHDPLTLAVIVFGIGLGIAVRQGRKAAVVVGMALYLLYVVKIGGDFMSGRFLTAPLLCAAALIATLPLARLLRPGYWRTAGVGGLFALLVGLGFCAPLPTWRIDPPAGYVVSDDKRVNDERAWYFADMGLLTRTPEQPFPTSQGRTGGLAALAESQKDYYVIPVNNIGLYGFYAGPQVYVIDQYALADPLLARLPAEREANFYVGHFHRELPDGYLSSVYSGKNLIEDARVAEYYDSLRMIVRGPLFSRQRWTAIWKMNTGQLDHLVNLDAYRYPEMVFKTDAQVEQLAAPLVFGDSGLEIDLCGCSRLTALELELAAPARYEVVFLGSGKVLGRERIDSNTVQDVRRVVVPSPQEWGVDTVRIFPLRGSPLQSYGLSHFRIVE